MSDKIRAGFLGTGSYLPDRILTNKDMEKIVDTTDEWIMTRTGIKERHIAAENQATSDLAVEAAKKALEAAGLKAGDIDLIIVATITPDMPTPSTACLVQSKLGAVKAAALTSQRLVPDLCTVFPSPRHSWKAECTRISS